MKNIYESIKQNTISLCFSVYKTKGNVIGLHCIGVFVKCHTCVKIGGHTLQFLKMTDGIKFCNMTFRFIILVGNNFVSVKYVYHWPEGQNSEERVRDCFGSSDVHVRCHCTQGSTTGP